MTDKTQSAALNGPNRYTVEQFLNFTSLLRRYTRGMISDEQFNRESAELGFTLDDIDRLTETLGPGMR